MIPYAKIVLVAVSICSIAQKVVIKNIYKMFQIISQNHTHNDINLWYSIQSNDKKFFKQYDEIILIDINFYYNTQKTNDQKFAKRFKI